jgi:hypothetical protein
LGIHEISPGLTEGFLVWGVGENAAALILVLLRWAIALVVFEAIEVGQKAGVCEG